MQVAEAEILSPGVPGGLALCCQRRRADREMLVSLLLVAGHSQEPMQQLSARVLLTILVTTVSAGCSYALGSHALIAGQHLGGLFAVCSDV